MKRTQLNFAIDVAAFSAFLFLLSTGLLLEYQLPAGSGALQGRGSGHGAADRDISLLWGWTRHDWGQIHFWIAGMLVAILAAHLILHWKWIICVLRGTHNDASGLRFCTGAVSLLALVLFVMAPFMSAKQRVTRDVLQQKQAAPEHVASDPTIDLRGSMTLAEVAEVADLSVPELIEALKFTEDIAANERVGPLLRRHGLQMTDLRRILGAVKHTSTKETEFE